jgi:low affinity Fe/Cu permease
MKEAQRQQSERQSYPSSAANVEGVPAANCRPDYFGALSAWTSHVMGGRWAFFIATLSVVLWAVTGPYFHYSQYWQLVINTGTTIVTFLMVFLIQNSQNREYKATNLKLDELILAVRRADNQLISIETLTEQQLDLLGERYRRLGEHYHREIEPSRRVTGSAAEPEQAQVGGSAQRL